MYTYLSGLERGSPRFTDPGSVVVFLGLKGGLQMAFALVRRGGGHDWYWEMTGIEE